MDWRHWARDPRQPSRPHELRARAAEWRAMAEDPKTPDACADSYRNAAAALEQRAYAITADARRLARQLYKIARSIETEPFHKSECGTVTVPGAAHGERWAEDKES